MSILPDRGLGSQQYRWDDSMAPAYGLPTGVTAPTFVALRGGNVYGWKFDGNDLLHGCIQLPHQLLENPVIKVHTHFMLVDATTGGETVGFRLDYTWATPNGTFGAEQNTGTVTHTVIGNEQYKHNIISLASITLTGAGPSTLFAFRLQKIDGTAGLDPVILSVDAHFQKGRFGTAEEFSE